MSLRQCGQLSVIPHRPMDNAKQAPTQGLGCDRPSSLFLFNPLRNSALQNIQIIFSRRLPFILRFHFSKRCLHLLKTDSAARRLEFTKRLPQCSLDCSRPAYTLDYTNPTITSDCLHPAIAFRQCVRINPQPPGLGRRTLFQDAKHLRSNGTLVRKHLRLSGTLTERWWNVYKVLLVDFRCGRCNSFGLIFISHE